MEQADHEDAHFPFAQEIPELPNFQLDNLEGVMAWPEAALPVPAPYSRDLFGLPTFRDYFIQPFQSIVIVTGLNMRVSPGCVGFVVQSSAGGVEHLIMNTRMLFPQAFFPVSICVFNPTPVRRILPRGVIFAYIVVVSTSNLPPLPLFLPREHMGIPEPREQRFPYRPLYPNPFYEEEEEAADGARDQQQQQQQQEQQQEQQEFY